MRQNDESPGHFAAEFERIISTNSVITVAIERAARLDLPDWWICGGLIRDTVWQHLLAPRRQTAIKDIDLVYYDATDSSKVRDSCIEAQLRPIAGIPWSVKNQARMYVHNNDVQYPGIVEGMYCFPETISAIGVKAGENLFI